MIQILLNPPIISVIRHGYVIFGMMKGSKWVQLQITWYCLAGIIKDSSWVLNCCLGFTYLSSNIIDSPCFSFQSSEPGPFCSIPFRYKISSGMSLLWSGHFKVKPLWLGWVSRCHATVMYGFSQISSVISHQKEGHEMRRPKRNRTPTSTQKQTLSVVDQSANAGNQGRGSIGGWWQQDPVLWPHKRCIAGSLLLN